MEVFVAYVLTKDKRQYIIFSISCPVIGQKLLYQRRIIMKKQTWVCPRCRTTNSLDATTCSICHQAMSDANYVTVESTKNNETEKSGGEQTLYIGLGILIIISGLITGIAVGITTKVFWTCFSILISALFTGIVYLGIGILCGRVEELKKAIENKRDK